MNKSSPRSGGKTRSVHPKNLQDKHGSISHNTKPLYVDKGAKRMKHNIMEACRPQVELLSEEIVRAGSGSQPSSPRGKRSKFSSELRPTIPNCPQNANIVEAQKFLAMSLYLKLIQEMKTRSKVAQFAEDFAHCEMLPDSQALILPPAVCPWQIVYSY